jgi:hypothetical protein
MVAAGQQRPPLGGVVQQGPPFFKKGGALTLLRGLNYGWPSFFYFKAKPCPPFLKPKPPIWGHNMGFFFSFLFIAL